MNRRGFLKVAASSAAVAPLTSVVAQVPIRPTTLLPELGEERPFVEDVYYDALVGSHTQNRRLPVSAGHRRGYMKLEDRIVYKRWNGKRWVRV